MKRKILIGFVVLIVAVTSAFNFTLREDGEELSGLSLANVEMLAMAAELPEFEITCGYYDGKCWYLNFSEWFTPCRFSGYYYDYCRKSF